jgi:hypothetical protein
MADDDQNMELRRSFKYQLLQNPNYFGNLGELDIPDLPGPVLQKVGDTTYEELTCVGYNPDTDILTAIVRVKLTSGYSGGPCTHGSREFVRFYLDYGPGGWVDHGVASFNVHDLDFKEGLCYAVSIKVGPKMRTCCDKRPVLPLVRAILSWNQAPPPNQPNWNPIWGNRLERHIQIHPRSRFLCLFDIIEAGTVKIDPELAAKLKAVLEAQPPIPHPTATLGELMHEGDQTDELHVLRHVFPAVSKYAAGNPDLAAFEVLQAAKIDLSKFGDFIANPKFNTSYEELTCVGLDRDHNLLHGIVQIKRPTGYSGGLCTAGSKEYIAFYLDFGAGWEYQGTTSVTVHNVPIPRSGLWYQAALPVNLDEHRRKWCETGRARIRGILSWAVPPAPNQPEFIPHWGDREDCWIEIRPWPHGVIPGYPFLEAIGNMPVENIAASGYANGPSIGATFNADDSPFGGAILIAGLIALPSTNNLEYRVMVRSPTDGDFKAWTQTFDAAVTTIVAPVITHTTVPQIAAGDWFDYIPQAGPPVFKSVAGNLLARFKATEEGLHRVYVEFREIGNPASTKFTATHFFMVDDTVPHVDVEIISGDGNCSTFVAGGEPISGTYTMTDAHSGGLSLEITPHPESNPGNLIITSAAPPGSMLALPKAGPNASNSLGYALLTLDGSGATGNWELITDGMAPCGYNIRIVGTDRTIVNSSGVHWWSQDIEGFCLVAETPIG